MQAGFDAVTGPLKSGDHARMSANQRDVGGAQPSVSGWSPRKLAEVQHTVAATRHQEAKDAVTGYPNAFAMAAHLSPEERHVGGRQESVSGWSPKKFLEHEVPGGNLDAPPRVHDVVRAPNDGRYTIHTLTHRAAPRSHKSPPTSTPGTAGSTRVGGRRTSPGGAGGTSGTAHRTPCPLTPALETPTCGPTTVAL